MKPYSVYLRKEAVEALRGIRGLQRQKIVSLINSLADDPFQEGDFAEHDGTGRLIYIKVLGRYTVRFWADHPVEEVKVVGIGKADRP